MIILWGGFILSLAALADAIAHEAYVAAFVLALGTHAILRQALWPKRS